MFNIFMRPVLTVKAKFLYYISRPFQHVVQVQFRITAADNDRVSASGKTRITAKSDY